jgi:hypothetical protein
MLANSSYHRVPEAKGEEEGRESLETAPGEDQRLLDPLQDDDHSPSPLKKTISGFKVSLHPTFYLRLAVLFLFTFAFFVFIATRLAHINAIPTIIFLAVAIFRNAYLLYDHLVSRSSPRIRIRIEVVGKTAKKSPNSGLPQRLLQVAIDWCVDHHYYLGWVCPCSRRLRVAGTVSLTRSAIEYVFH